MGKLSSGEMNALPELTEQGKDRARAHARQVWFPKPMILSITFSFPYMLLVPAAASIRHLPALKWFRQNVPMVAGTSPREVLLALYLPPPAPVLLALAPMGLEGTTAWVTHGSISFLHWWMTPIHRGLRWWPSSSIMAGCSQVMY